MITKKRGLRLLAVFVAMVMFGTGIAVGAPASHAASTASVTIKVTTKSGVAAPGLYVALGDEVKKTRADGTAKFKGLKKGSRSLVVSETKGYITTGWKYSTKVRLNSGKNGTKTVRATNLTVIRGKVTRNGKAVKGASVSVRVRTSGRTRVATSSEDGRYAISLGKKSRSDRQIQVSAETKKGRITYAPGTLRRSETKSYTVSWSKSHTVNIAVQKGPKGWVKGKVLHANGKPAIGATVRLYVDRTDVQAEEVRAVLSDDRGRYAIGNLAPGTYQILAEDAGSRGVGRSASRSVVIKNKKVAVSDLSFRKTGTVKVPLTAVSNDGTYAVGLLDDSNRIVRSEHVYLSGDTPAGSVTFTYVPEGNYRATVVGTGLITGKITVAGGDVITSSTIAVPQATAISGKIVLPDGEGVPGQLNFLDVNGMNSTYYASNSTGLFSAKGFYPGAYRVFVDSDQTVTVGSRKSKLVQRDVVSFNVTAGSPVTGLSVPLEVAGKAEGEVKLPGSTKALIGIEVTATRVKPTGIGALDVVHASVGKKGKYLFDKLVPGIEYRIAFADEDAVHPVTWYGGKKGKKSAAKSAVITVDAKSTKKLGLTTMRG